MNNLSNTVRDYFVSHFEELPLDKQLHFASRLWFWKQDETARRLLDNLRPKIIPTGDIIDSLRQIQNGHILPLRQGSANVFHLREAHFLRYPSLRPTATTLYWGLILDTCYNLDARSRLGELLPLSELQGLYDSLITDPEATAILSTHAVNFMYLYQRYVRKNEVAPHPADFISLALNDALYLPASPLHAQLKIYLLTHTIIGESMFYQRTLTPEKVKSYLPVIRLLEAIIDAQFQSVNLDNKLEFLVCCQLLSYQTGLEKNILAEAAASLSSEGDFLIDTHNTNPQSAYTSFDKSEHRSLLFLLATTQRDFK